MPEVYVGCALLASGFVVARWAGEGGVRNVLAVLTVLFACVCVWWMEGGRFVRFAAALIGAVLFARSVGFVLEGAALSRRQRLLTLLAICDARRLERVAPQFDAGKLLSTALHGLGCALVVLTLIETPLRGPHAQHWLLRWLLGAVAVYMFVPSVIGTVESLWLAAGWRLPPSHRHPVLARSVAEFWSRRWNLIVHRYLWRYAFIPVLGKNGPTLALAWVFFLSGLLHAWYVAVVFRGEFLIVTLLFFNAQTVFILFERARSIRHWPRAAQHLWTTSCLLLPSPAFVEPVLRIFSL